MRTPINTPNVSKQEAKAKEFLNRGKEVETRIVRIIEKKKTIITQMLQEVTASQSLDKIRLETEENNLLEQLIRVLESEKRYYKMLEQIQYAFFDSLDKELTPLMGYIDSIGYSYKLDIMNLKNAAKRYRKAVGDMYNYSHNFIRTRIYYNSIKEDEFLKRLKGSSILAVFSKKESILNKFSEHAKQLIQMYNKERENALSFEQEVQKYSQIIIPLGQEWIQEAKKINELLPNAQRESYPSEVEELVGETDGELSGLKTLGISMASAALGYATGKAFTNYLDRKFP